MGIQTMQFVNGNGCIECDNYAVGDVFTFVLNGQQIMIVASRSMLDDCRVKRGRPNEILYIQDYEYD